MQKIFLFAIVFMFIIIIAMFFFVSQISVGTQKTAQELSLELDKVSSPIYTPLGFSTAFFKLILSIVSFFTGG